MRPLVLGVLAVLLAAGCVGDIGQDITGGGNILAPKTEQTGPPGIIAVENQQVRPSPPIISESPFSVSWQVRNTETKQDISDMTIQIYDWGDCAIDTINDYSETMFRIGTKRPANYSGITEPKAGSPTKAEDFYTIVPAFRAGSVRQVKLDLTAPKTVLTSSCSIKSKITYRFSALSELDVQTISPTYLRQIGTASYQATERIGPGPIQIRMAPQAALPARSGSQLPVKVWVDNVGGGVFGDIPYHTLKIEVPGDWSFTKDTSNLAEGVQACDKFDKPQFDSQTGKWVMYNNGELAMVTNSGTQSEPVMCYFKMPEVELTKDATIQASIEYTYDIHSSINVDINPVMSAG